MFQSVWKTWYKIMDTLDSAVTQRKQELIDQNINDKLISGFLKDYDNHRLSAYCLKSTRMYSSSKLGRRKRAYRVSHGVRHSFYCNFLFRYTIVPAQVDKNAR